MFASLRDQFAKGTSRAKAVKITKSLFNKRQAVGRMYDYLDDAARTALYDFVEAEDVLEEEIEYLGKIAQTYQAEIKQALTKAQLDDLLGDSGLGSKGVEEVVNALLEARLQLESGKNVIKNISKVEYGSDDLSKVAIQFRKANGITSARRNVCVVEYKDADGNILKEVFISNANSHSEELMLEYMKKNDILGKNIIKIFSEREPCVETATNIGHNCANYIMEYMPDAEVVYAVEYGATRESGLNARNSLKELLENLLY